MIALPIMIGVGLYIKERKKWWIFVNTKPDISPYKLVYKVIKFVASHKDALLHTNDFIDNDFNLPSSRLRFDLGKERYGGPFATKQVEEVKSFLRIFCILLTLGPALMMDIAERELLPNLEFHMDGHLLFDTVIDRYFYDYNNLNYDLLKSFISNGILSPLIVVVILPFYIGLLQHRMYNYIPGPLKRIGLGMFFILLSGLCSLSMDTYGHLHSVHNATSCFLTLKLHDIFTLTHLVLYLVSAHTQFSSSKAS